MFQCFKALFQCLFNMIRHVWLWCLMMHNMHDLQCLNVCITPGCYNFHLCRTRTTRRCIEWHEGQRRTIGCGGWTRGEEWNAPGSWTLGEWWRQPTRMLFGNISIIYGPEIHEFWIVVFYKIIWYNIYINLIHLCPIVTLNHMFSFFYWFWIIQLWCNARAQI
jgi:hypothetical protein